MSDILIIHAGRYGSTKQVAELIAGSLREKGVSVTVSDVAEGASVDGYRMVLLGSGIYSHRFLPEIETFIEDNREKLSSVCFGLFGVAMRTEIMHRNGRSFGGELVLDRYGLNPAVKGMLHGRIDFSKLSHKDRAGLERFYSSIGLTEEQKAERKKLRDEVSPKECEEFAGRVAGVLAGL